MSEKSDLFGHFQREAKAEPRYFYVNEVYKNLPAHLRYSAEKYLDKAEKGLLLSANDAENCNMMSVIQGLNLAEENLRQVLVFINDRLNGDELALLTSSISRSTGKLLDQIYDTYYLKCTCHKKV